MDKIIEQKIHDFLIPLLIDDGLELFVLRVFKHRKTMAVQVFIDRPEGGITIDECSKVNRLLNLHIEDSGIIPEDYTIEVSSPGLDWPLKTKKDFIRISDNKVQFYLKEPLENKIELKGNVTQVDDQGVCVRLKMTEIFIDYSNIQKAVVII